MAAVTSEIMDLMDRDAIMALMGTLSKAAALQPDDYYNKYNALADRTEAQLIGYADRLAAGQGMTPYQFRDAVLRTLRRAMADAYRYGVGASGVRPILVDQDLQKIRESLSEDRAYLDKFTQQLIRGDVPGYNPGAPGIIQPTGHFSVQERTKMYANAIRAQFFSGLASRGSSTQLYDWVLGDSEHCGPCVDMAAGSPYTIATLAGRYPGAGVCLGLDRCACSLISRQ